MKHLDINNNQHNERPDRHGPVLLQPRLPSEFLGPPRKVFGFGLQFLAHGAHVIELFAAIEYFVNVFAHNGLNFRQVLVEFGFLLGRVAKFALFSLDNGVVVNELKGSGGLVDRVAPRRSKFLHQFLHDGVGHFFQIQKGHAFGIGLFRERQETKIFAGHVVIHRVAAVNAHLVGVARRHAAQQFLGILLHLIRHGKRVRGGGRGHQGQGVRRSSHLGEQGRHDDDVDRAIGLREESSSEACR
mmetsp:Transcript_17639/g.48056  ORF Transcript_17639/g.48056 Transcript_17639/m.48056 type:complete len:243 (+) Transcript_17639:1793-2521(+)